MSDAIVQVGPVEVVAGGKPIVRAVLGGTLGTDAVSLLKGWAEGLHETVKESATGDHSVCVLIDLSNFGTYTNPEIIMILSRLMKDDNPYVYRTATFGGNRIHEMAESVIASISGRKNIKNFKMEEDARIWLTS